MWSKRGLKKTNQRVENRSFWREFREIYSKKLDIGVITQHDRYTEIKKKTTSKNQSFEHNRMEIFRQQRVESL